jgi:hypothetical protein
MAQAINPANSKTGRQNSGLLILIIPLEHFILQADETLLVRPDTPFVVCNCEEIMKSPEDF